MPVILICSVKCDAISRLLKYGRRLITVITLLKTIMDKFGDILEVTASLINVIVLFCRSLSILVSYHLHTGICVSSKTFLEFVVLYCTFFHYNRFMYTID